MVHNSENHTENDHIYAPLRWQVVLRSSTKASKLSSRKAWARSWWLTLPATMDFLRWQLWRWVCIKNIFLKCYGGFIIQTTWYQHVFNHVAWEAAAEGNRFLCGTICLDTLQETIEKRIATKLFNDCRSGSLQIHGFPQFDGLIKTLKDGNAQASTRNYEVCIQQNGKLIILQSFAAKFTESEITKDDAVALIKEHNEKYNVDGAFWMSEERCPHIG